MILNKIFYFFTSRDLKEQLREIIKVLFSAVLGFALASMISDTQFFWIAIATIVVLIILYSIALSKSKHQFDVINILVEEQKKSNWIEIIRFGYPLSRPLWLSGRYEMRTEIGEFLKEASSSISGEVKVGNDSINSNYILASVLIDDLGWTRFILGQTERARKNILEGIHIATSNSYWSLVIKGYRHLLAFYEMDNNGEEFDKTELMIEDLINQHINSVQEKEEILAGIKFSKAEHDYSKGYFNVAITNVLDAQAIYLRIKDYERYVKTFDLLGSIYCKMNNLNQAEITLRQAISQAKKWQRKERYIKSATSLLELKKRMISDGQYTLQERVSQKEEIENIYKSAKKICIEIQNKAFLKEIEKTHKEVQKILSKK